VEDFFINYTTPDRPWAEWITWTLEENGYSVKASSWQPDDTVTQVWRRSVDFDRGIVLLSKNYLKLMDAAQEQAVIEDLYRLIRDRQLIPIRVEECRLTGWLAAIAYLDLVGTSEPEAEQAILEALQKPPESDRALPADVVDPSEQTIHVDTSTNEQLKQQRQSYSVQFFVEPLNQETGIEMMQIPAGTFLMGSPEDELDRRDSESPQHEVNIAAFFMGKYPVTQAQWKAIAAMPQVNRSLEPEPSYFKGADRPVEEVSWYDVVEFCDRLSTHSGRNYRLPTEAEWEYACRAGTTTPFHFGETITTDLANYAGTDDPDGKWSGSYDRGPKGEHRKETTPVDQFGIANAFGLCNMHGNVWERCQDNWHSNYEGAPADGSAWLSEEENAERILRGGSWDDYPRYCRSASRDLITPDYASYYVGFRVVCQC
jgi:formylglycine-generating enzyme required for sulfatase activity